MMSLNYYPPVSFHFAVFFSSKVKPWDLLTDSKFLSVTGLNFRIEYDEYPQGGDTTPVRTFKKLTHDNLTLKRGLEIQSELTQWCKSALTNPKTTEPKDLTVVLLDTTHAPLMVWNVKGALPVSWTIDEFNAMENKLAMETIVLNYQYFTISGIV